MSYLRKTCYQLLSNTIAPFEAVFQFTMQSPFAPWIEASGPWTKGMAGGSPWSYSENSELREPCPKDGMAQQTVVPKSFGLCPPAKLQLGKKGADSWELSILLVFCLIPCWKFISLLGVQGWKSKCRDWKVHVFNPSSSASQDCTQVDLTQARSQHGHACACTPAHNV